MVGGEGLADHLLVRLLEQWVIAPAHLAGQATEQLAVADRLAQGRDGGLVRVR